jgi:predicted RNase H-like HicB family nuclease
MKIEFEREDDGRWIAAVPDLPGVMVYGETRNEARQRVTVLAMRVLAGKIEAGEIPSPVSIAFSAA